MLVADHLVQVDRVGALGQRPEQAARLDLAELLGIADQDELCLCLLGVVDQPRQVGGVDHPGLVDQQDRAVAKQASRPPARRARARRAGWRRSSPAGPRRAGRSPPARSALPTRSSIPASRPALAPRRGSRSSCRCRPRRSRRATPSRSASRRRTISRWSAFRVGWAREHPRGDQLARPPRRPRLRIRSAVSSASRSSSQMRLVVKRSPFGLCRSGAPASEARNSSAIRSTSAAGAPSRRSPATAWIASRRSKWEALAVTARSTCRCDRAMAAVAWSRGVPRVRRGRRSRWIASRSRPISSRPRAPALVQGSRLEARAPSARAWPGWRLRGRGRRLPALPPPRGFRRGGWRTRAGGRRRSPRSRRCRCGPLASATPRLRVSSWRRLAS